MPGGTVRLYTIPISQSTPKTPVVLHSRKVCFWEGLPTKEVLVSQYVHKSYRKHRNSPTLFRGSHYQPLFDRYAS